MTLKLITLPLIAIALTATAGSAQARSIQDKIDAYNRCEANGGSTAVCCVAAGGDLTLGGHHPPGKPNVTILDSCMITADLSPGASSGGGGKPVLITKPGQISVKSAN